MCRLVAYSGPAVAIEALVFGGTHSLHTQAWAPRELRSGSVNVDGFGVAWAAGAASPIVRIARVEPIWHDPDLPALLGAFEASVALAALRNATPGLPVDRSGVLPLVRGDYAFALNGFVPEFRSRHMRALREPLTDPWYARLTGSGDAETLCHRILQEIEEGATAAEAMLRLREVVAGRVQPGESAPLTMVLMSPGGVTALHTAVHGPLNSLYLGSGAAPAPAGVLLASEPLSPGGAWEPVPPHSIVELREGKAQVEAV